MTSYTKMFRNVASNVKLEYNYIMVSHQMFCFLNKAEVCDACELTAFFPVRCYWLSYQKFSSNRIIYHRRIFILYSHDITISTFRILHSLLHEKLEEVIKIKINENNNRKIQNHNTMQHWPQSL